jgi:hypothetical protein
MDEAPLAAIWVYLAASPLLWPSLTLVCYLIALWVYDWAARALGSTRWPSPWAS